jgi:hypothetical protein
MVLGAVALSVGATMYWAVTYQVTGVRLPTVGVILMIAGAFGFVASSTTFAVSSCPQSFNRHSMNPQVAGTSGNTSSAHEDSK